MRPDLEESFDAFVRAHGERFLRVAVLLAGAQLLRRVRTLVPAGAVAALGGAVALGVALTTTVADAPSAVAAVTAAAAKTSADSFSVTATQTQTQVISSASGHGKPVTMRITGVFDPKRGLGEEIVTGGSQIRFVGGHMYARLRAGSPLGHGKSWVEAQLPPPPLSGTAAGPLGEGFNGNEPIDPSALLGLLKSAGSVQAEGPASGPGWTGTKYAFAVPELKGSIVTESGTVYVDNQGRVRRLMTTDRHRVVTFSSTRTTLDFTIMSDVTFGGFGVRVSVTAPPPRQVVNLGKGYLIIFGGGLSASLNVGANP